MSSLRNGADCSGRHPPPDQPVGPSSLLRRPSSRRKSGSSSGATGRRDRWGRIRGGRGDETPPLPPEAAAARMSSTTTPTATRSTTRNAAIGTHPPRPRPMYVRRNTRKRTANAVLRTRRTETVIDAVDQQLIDLLRANGRASYAELARQVGLSSPAVHERVAKLEAAGVISGYRAVIDPASVGLNVTALVGVIESDSVDDTGVEEALRATSGIEDCWRVAGSEGYVLKVRVPDIPALEATISELNRIRGVARTRTTVVLSTKWEGRHG